MAAPDLAAIARPRAGLNPQRCIVAVCVAILALFAYADPARAADVWKINGIFDADTGGSEIKGTATNKINLFVEIEYDGVDGEDSVSIHADSVTLFAPATMGAMQGRMQGRKRISVDLKPFANGGTINLRAVLTPKDGTAPRHSNEVPVTIDTIGPRLQSVDLVGTPGNEATLHIRFVDADFVTVGTSSFKIYRLIDKDKVEPFNYTLFDRQANLVRIFLGPLAQGSYEVIVDDSLTDAAGNKPGINSAGILEKQSRHFSSFPGPEPAPHIAFPRFLPPNDFQDEKPFNPGAHVETRVARLYYYRDAHRVAQIINRTVKSYNAPAVSQAQRLAENLREDANDMQQERAHLERAAVARAQATRQAEADLANARAALEQTRAFEARRIQSVAELQQLIDGESDDDERRTALEIEKTRLEALKATAETAITQLRGKVAELESAVGSLRAQERAAQEEGIVAQEREDRSRERQFRAEVAAATADPDTYAPADKNSVDPVTQVSISVIGEGLIQLRGPIAGINEIRTMINQIDAPVGQVKIGIFTVQINGEHGDRMEKVAGRIEGHIDLSRFLTSQSLMLLRRAIQETAGEIAAVVDARLPGHTQLDRDRKYVYVFFGRDFIDELYAMDSEFLHTGNKLLSLHSMDTISLSKSLFILSLARNDIRQMILARFMELVRCELPEAEYDFRRTTRLLPKHMDTPEEIFQNAFDRYTFRSVRGYFDANVVGGDTMTPTQREFIRLAQVFKSQMVAEAELKQRVVERGLIQDASNDEKARARRLTTLRATAVEAELAAHQQVLVATQTAQSAHQQVRNVLKRTSTLVQHNNDLGAVSRAINALIASAKGSDATRSATIDLGNRPVTITYDPNKNRFSGDGVNEYIGSTIDTVNRWIQEVRSTLRLTAADDAKLTRIVTGLAQVRTKNADTEPGVLLVVFAQHRNLYDLLEPRVKAQKEIQDLLGIIEQSPKRSGADWNRLVGLYRNLHSLVETEFKDPDVRSVVVVMLTAAENVNRAVAGLEHAQFQANATRAPLDHRKLLDFLIDEQHEKYIELVEATRSHIAAVDNHLKRLAIALEDDFKMQFYDPAFADIRGAAREWDVNLGQVERTTLLTNNRAFAKVSPQATMEFDLPKRDVMIVEAMEGARALVQEYGTLLQDPTFLSLTGMLSGSPATIGVPPGIPMSGLPNQGLAIPSVRSVLPTLPSESAEQLMTQTGGPDRRFGAAIEGLIPDPAIYKFETGTGFEIRPVIQPDGDAVVYDFDYMYTTNVREPVRADEKHLGRVKRHFIHTQVQTSSYELREVSRYMVALKASRTSRGVPLLEDVPALGVLFRPLPQQESSLQQNIILAQSTVYPTLFDLMGLRWAPAAVDLDHVSLRDAEHVVRGRRTSITNFVFDESSRRVDGFLDLKEKTPEQYRPDLYHRQILPSPYHPGGHVVPGFREDPSGNRFQIPDRRPEEMRDPPYDELHRDVIRPEALPPAGPAPLLLQPRSAIPFEAMPPGPTIPPAPAGAAMVRPDPNVRQAVYQPRPNEASHQKPGVTHLRPGTAVVPRPAEVRTPFYKRLLPQSRREE